MKNALQTPSQRVSTDPGCLAWSTLTASCACRANSALCADSDPITLPSFLSCAIHLHTPAADGECVECGFQQVSPPGSPDSRRCQCRAGYGGSDSCSQCPKGSFWPGPKDDAYKQDVDDSYGASKAKSQRLASSLPIKRPIKRSGCRPKLCSTPAHHRPPLECSPASAALTSLVVASTLCLLVRPACTNVHASQVRCPATVSLLCGRTGQTQAKFSSGAGHVVCCAVRRLLLVACVQVMEATSAASVPRESGAG